MVLHTLTDKLAFKSRLRAHCLALIQQRIDTATAAMEQAQESANSEDKSSAGDKYETGRAMSHIERDNYAYQLSVAIDDRNQFLGIDCEKQYDKAENGAIISGGDVLYFIATGLGVMTFEGLKVVALSPKAPLSGLLRGKSKGDTVTLNGKALILSDIF
ncbi:MAG: 3-oxoacyl-ACP synthase [Bacteroidetes bacterium]|nr:3-oxoacyl-ACP synthase [Bacteroidota bacterium]